MFLSIIIPVYNVENYLEECLKSIQRQTFEHFEVILVNDGSTDSSLTICEKFSKEDERFQIYSKSNQGQGIARNYGLTKAQGTYVTFLDSDDYIDDNYLTYLVSPVLLDDSITMVVGGYKKVDNNAQLFYEEIYEERKILSEELSLRMLGAMPDKEDSIKGTVWNSLYKTDIIVENGIEFQSERVFFSEDTCFNLDYLKHSKVNILIPSTEYSYRLNLESTSTKFDSKKLVLINEYFNYITNRFSNNEEAKLRVSKIYLFNLKRVLFQEKYNKNNKKFNDIHRNIKKILNNNTVTEVLGTYPIIDLNSRNARIIFWFCKYKFSYILSFLIWHNLGRNKRYVKGVDN